LNKNEIQDIINCKQGVVENLLKRVNKCIQRYMAGDSSLSKNLNSEINISEEENPTNKNSKINKESFGEYDSYDRIKLLKSLKQRDSQIEELKNIVDVDIYFLNIQILEMKLKNSSEIQLALEKRINQLKDILKQYGHI
jgi:hypothetical protein